MRQLTGHSLWLGRAAELRDLRALHEAGILAAIDLAINESPAAMPREIVYCRFPLIDGAGNPPWLVRLAVESWRGFSVRAGRCWSAVERALAGRRASLRRRSDRVLEIAGRSASNWQPRDVCRTSRRRYGTRCVGSWTMSRPSLGRAILRQLGHKTAASERSR